LFKFKRQNKLRILKSNATNTDSVIAQKQSADVTTWHAIHSSTDLTLDD